jgi:hypothetical protein
MSGVSIGRQRVGAKRNYREEQILASNELALDTTSGRSGYWQAMSWRWTQYREERVLASNALALDATGYKRDLARVRA